jgi:hypothetical protein
MPAWAFSVQCFDTGERRLALPVYSTPLVRLMSDAGKAPSATIRREMLEALAQLVEALDRRVPRLERIGEEAIARDAARLREQAVTLIAKLKGEEPA